MMRGMGKWLLALLGCLFSTAVLAGEVALLVDGNRAGILISVPEGAKTYWRMPGESGVAPVFNWQGSQNLKSISVAFPAPRRFAGADGETVGYDRDVLLPLTITPMDAALPVEIKLKLDYGICRELCEPAHAELAARTGVADAAAGAAITAAEGLVPVPVSGIEARDSGKGLWVRLPAGMAADDIFVEGAPLAYFRAPVPDGEGWLLPKEGLSGPLSGQDLILTLVSGVKAHEARLRVP